MRKLFSLLGLFFLCFGFLVSQEQKPGEHRLTLEECLVMALEKNLDISVEAFTPEIQVFSILESKNKFLPRLTVNYDNLKYYRLSNWFVEGTQFTTKTDSYSIGLRQSVITGGEIDFSLSNETTDTTQSLVTINPTYRGEVQFHINQPLLKNFGPKINRREIRKARNQRDISVYELKSTLIRKVYEVEEAYWNLVQAIENLKIREISLMRSKARLKITKEAARIGAKTPIDVLSSETDVASQESNVLSARSSVDMREEILRKLLNLPNNEMDLTTSIVPIDMPQFEKKEIAFEEALKIALQERPELSSIQREIANSNIDVSYYKNQLLPELNLDFRLWFPGQSGDRLIYRDNNPLTGEVIDTVKGSRGDSMRDVFDLKYDNWYLRVDLTIPLENFLSRASLARAKMEKEQKLLEIEREKKSIYNELFEIFKELKNNEERIETSTKLRELREKKLEAEEERYRLGLTTTDWLFTHQERYIAARISEISAIIDYKLSVALLEKILGTNLESKNLKFRDYDF